jgi:hypothetical protein
VSRPLSWCTTLLACCCLAAPALVALDAPAANAVEMGSLSAKTSSSWQTDATVWKMTYADGDMWMVGDFTTLRPPNAKPGVDTQSALYFAALKASTGAPDTTIDDTHVFAGQKSGTLPLTDGVVAASPNGKTIYVGGNFTSVDGQPRDHVAAFSASTGELTAWNPDAGGRVRAIAASGNVVYIGGDFGKVGGATRGNLAAVSSSGAGAVVSWGSGTQPSTDNTVDALAVTKNGAQVVAGGYFDKVDGLTKSTAYNKAVVIGGIGSAKAGKLEPLPADRVVPPGTDSHRVKTGPDLCSSDVKDIVIAHGDVYFADEGTGIGCFDGTWAAHLAGGKLKWVNRCLGATQTIEVVGDYLYKGSHAHDCQSANKNHDPDNFPSLPHHQVRHLLSERLSNGFLGPWYPLANAGVNLGPRAMATDGKQLYVGGDFSKVNGLEQQGVARFTTTTDYPTPQPAAPKVTSTSTGVVDVTATPPVDPDDPDLVMELFRNGGTKPIAKTDVHSLFWRQPAVHWVVRGLRPNAHPVFRVRAVERFGGHHSPLSAAKHVTVDCGRPSAVRAALVSAHAKRVSAKLRQVSIQVCESTTMKIEFEVRRGASVLAHKVELNAAAGDQVVKLDVGNKVARGKIKAYVVFTRSSHQRIATRKLRLPR